MRFIDLMGVVLALVFAGIVVLLLARCTPVPVPVPPDPTPQGGAGPVLSDCEAAGERLEELGCRDGSGTPLWRTPEGKSFAEACAYSLEQGRDWCPEALAKIANCGEIDFAMRSCK